MLKGFLENIDEVNPSKEDVALMKKLVAQLQELFLLVVVGEFNAGKSSFLNALLGNKYVNLEINKKKILEGGGYSNNIESWRFEIWRRIQGFVGR